MICLVITFLIGGGDETLFQRLVKQHSFEKNFPARLSNKREWQGESSTYPLNANTIKYHYIKLNLTKRGKCQEQEYRVRHQILRVNDNILASSKYIK